MTAPVNNQRLAWGARVSQEFRQRVMQIAVRIGAEASELMACMAFETGKTFSPSIRNSAGSGAVGLIQFMPRTAIDLGTTVDELSKMSAVDQLAYVERYFLPYRNRLKSLDDVYMAILWPAAVGRSSGHVLFRRDDPDRPKRYIQNCGLDFNNDGLITKGEAAAKVRNHLVMGLMPGNVGPV